MRGILKIALKLLVNDRGKFAALIVGITFAIFLIVQLTSIFSGILAKASSTVINTGARVWVMDPSVQNPLNTIPLPDYVLDAVRSMNGVKYAVPLYSGVGLVKLKNGVYQPATVLGLDDTSLIGRPDMIEGRMEDIFADNAFIVVKDQEYAKLDSPSLGTTFEINDHRGVVVGIARVPVGNLFGIPTLYTTYSRAVQYLPNARFTIGYVLVKPKSEAAIPAIIKDVANIGYMAMTDRQFEIKVSNYYKYQTGVGTNILFMTVIGFLVGLSISGQTFYTFVLENLEKFGALKAIGAKNSELVLMILFQATFASVVGYGLGVGMSSLLIAAGKRFVPNYTADIDYWNLALAFVLVLLIAALSSLIAVKKVIRVQPFEIFRG
ncbi:MAG: ABC transporter permease [Syntrophobacteraceae bacterium]|nr:ABC transporter permease [Syntrophobacteraceae bacterium]